MDSPFEKMLAGNPLLKMGYEAVKSRDESAALLARSYWNAGYLHGQIDAVIEATANLRKKVSA